jgi:hypothetical protein
MGGREKEEEEKEEERKEEGGRIECYQKIRRLQITMNDLRIGPMQPIDTKSSIFCKLNSTIEGELKIVVMKN